MIEETLALGEFTCGWSGVKIRAFYRERSNDQDCLSACIIADEYRFRRLLGPVNYEMARSGVAVDLGAHIGGATLALISAGFYVRAVEILPENAAILRKNIELNGWENRCQVFEGAIWSTDSDSVRIWQTEAESASGRMHRHMSQAMDPGDTRAVPRGERTARTYSLDTVLRNFATCRILKSDCEGGEYPAFAACTKLTCLERVVMEYHKGNREELVAWFPGYSDVTETLGFKTSEYIALTQEGIKIYD